MSFKSLFYGLACSTFLCVGCVFDFPGSEQLGSRFVAQPNGTCFSCDRYVTEASSGALVAHCLNLNVVVELNHQPYFNHKACLPET